MFFVSTQKWEKSFKMVQKNTRNCQRYQFYFILFLYFKAFDLLQCHVTFIYLFFLYCYCCCCYCCTYTSFVYALRLSQNVLFGIESASRSLWGKPKKQIRQTLPDIESHTQPHTTPYYYQKRGGGIAGGNREQCAPQFVIARTQIVSIFYYALLQQYIHMGQSICIYVGCSYLWGKKNKKCVYSSLIVAYLIFCLPALTQVM